MILARRILPFISPLILIALLSGVLFQPMQWAYWTASIAIVVVLTMGFMVSWKFRSADFWGILFPVFTLLAGGIGSLFFVNSLTLRVVYGLLLVTLFGVYIEDVFIYRFQQHRYTQLSLPNLSFFISTLGALTLFSFMFALRLIGILSVWQITATAVIFGVTFMIHVLWSYQVWHPRYAAYALLTGLLVGELAWVLQFWPTALFVNGTIMAVLIYVFPSLIQMRLRDTITRASVTRYIIVCVVTLVAVLTTSQWT